MKINQQHQSEAEVLTLQGDFISVPDQLALQDKVRKLVSGGINRIIIDLAGVKYINSCGLGSLVCALTTARKAGGDLRLAGIGIDVDKVLKMTKLDTIFPIYPNIVSAMSQSSVHA